MNSHEASFTSRTAEGNRKRDTVRKYIELYYFQLREGCGNSQCDNEHCASNPFIQQPKPDQAAALALKLFQSKAKLCVSHDSKGGTPKDAKLLLESPSQSKISDSVSLSNITTPTDEATCMDISICSDGDLNKSSNHTSFSSDCCTMNSAAKKVNLDSSANSKDNTCSSDGIVDSVTNSRHCHTVGTARVTVALPLAEMPSPAEEPCCMDTSESGEQVKGNFLHFSNAEVPSTSVLSQPSSSSSSSNLPEGVASLDEESLLAMIEDCKKQQSFSLLIRTIGQVFSSEKLLQQSFTKKCSKEDIRAMEVDEDKDKDSKEAVAVSEPESSTKTFEVTVDIESVRRAFKALFSLPDSPCQGALINALLILSENLDLDFKYNSINSMEGNILNVFVIVMEIPLLECPEYMEAAFPAFCKAAGKLPVEAQGKLAQVWSTFTPEKLTEMVNTIHQFITLKVITGQFTRDYCINDDEVIVAATKLMKVLYFANMFGGVMDVETHVTEETEPTVVDDNFQDLLQGAIGVESKEPKPVKEDPLGQELGFKPLDCRTPVISFDEFYNEPLSDQLEMDRDFACYKTDGGKFSFMNYSFILTPAVKSLGLYYDNRIRMYSERRISVLHSLVHGAPPNPYLKLRVRRDHIIDDALVGLEMIAMESPNNLKKQLVVEFEGEQGIDEGGVSKEFFQLVIDEVFNPDFAMFTLNAETQTYWFNPTSFESDGQFTLIGIILGLAIYNNVILDVHFPMVLYRKLMGKRGTFFDLQDWNPILSKGLQELLAYEGDDVENVFVQTFRISYQDVFGTVLVHDLKENGHQILVNQSNKKEFVELYASFLLNKAVQEQFRAFKRGFQMVTDDSPLKMLFRPEEVELLVCGSKNFDFNALEETTDYDGGYVAETPIIRWFWELVHEFSLDQKRKLLQFATGSDRVPVGGLSKLKLVIARHGPDSDRLPTAHTCFNVLLLPEYISKEKLEERLLKAINYSKGFGML